MRGSSLQNVANGLLTHFISRNNDSGGFWGIGVIAGTMWNSRREQVIKELHPPFTPLIIHGHTYFRVAELARHLQQTVDFSYVRMEIRRLQIIENGYPDGRDRHVLSILFIVGNHITCRHAMTTVSCWPHDRTMEQSRRKSD